MAGDDEDGEEVGGVEAEAEVEAEVEGLGVDVVIGLSG